MSYRDLRTGLLPAGFLASGSLYTKPKASQDVENLRLPDSGGSADALLIEREMEMKILNQLNPAKIGRHLQGLQSGPGAPVRAREIATDLDGFIRLLYSASYAEAGRERFPFRVRWETGRISNGPYSFQDHTYLEEQSLAP